MRLRIVRAVLVLVLLGNIIVWHRIWRLFTSQSTLHLLSPNVATNEPPQKLHRRLARFVTIVIRQFESFENDVASMVESVLNSFPTIPILIVCDELPYPPLDLDFANESMRNVRLISLQPDFNKSFQARNPLFYIRTKYVLFLPDATRLSTKQVIEVKHLYLYKETFDTSNTIVDFVIFFWLCFTGGCVPGVKVKNSYCTSGKNQFGLS